MYSNTNRTIPVILPRLPRGLAILLILSLVLPGSVRDHKRRPHPLPPPTVFAEPGAQWIRCRRARARSAGPRRRRFQGMDRTVVRCLIRAALLTSLLGLSGWTHRLPLSASLLAIPVSQMVLQTLALGMARPGKIQARWMTHLQRLYQLALVALLLSLLVQFLSALASGHALGPLALATWATRPDDDTELRVTLRQKHQYAVTLRGTFTLIWEPRDSFEVWMLVLFLRQLRRPGQSKPFLTQRQLAAAFECGQAEVSRWERQVRAHSWHYLSDRFRRTLQSVLPNAELSHAILQLWVPAFWLSAWEVRERLMQQGVLANREALDLESLHALAQQTGFQRLREILLKRFDLQQGHLIAREHWWLNNLLALNERLIGKLERGEGLTPQELIAIEPLRLKTPEKLADSEAPPLAAMLKSALFDPRPEPAGAVPEPARCTYCDSDHTAPKSQQPRLKTIIDAFGEKHILPVLRSYCKNPACPYQSFTHLPRGVLPHSPFPVQVRVLAVEVYVQLLSTYRRSARMFTVKASTVYHWVASVSPAALCLAAYLGVVRTSGVVGIDDKWIKVCSPSAVRPHGTRPRAVWRYVYVAVDAYSYDLLAIQLYPEHSDEAVRLFLLELKAKGLRPRVVVSDLDPAYGRMLPLVFPQALHHECIFHAVQNALKQMTKVYGRYYLEKVPETAPLHDAITGLFQAHAQKTVRQRFAKLMELRSGYVTRTPDIACVFDSLERHFPKLVNAIESSEIPCTNNATELVIRRFDQHYQSMCGLDSFASAQVYLRLFELVYRLTPFADDDRPEIRGRCPLELAGYDLHQLPIAEFFMNLKLPPLALQGPEVVPMP